MKLFFHIFLADIAKLIFGGVVLYSVVRQDVDHERLVIFGAASALLILGLSVALKLWNDKSNNKK